MKKGEVKSINIQDSVLNQLRKEKKRVRLVLINGDELVGTVDSFDGYTILFKTPGETYLIYKHSVSYLGYFS